MSDESDKLKADKDERRIVYFAQRYERAATQIGVAFDDLIRFGSAGQREADRSYDPTTGIRFETHASDCIRQSIARGITKSLIASGDEAEQTK